MKDQVIKERAYGTIELCSAEIQIAGQTLVPDQSKAYCELHFCNGFTKTNRVVTAYGTAFHPGTVANSAPSLLHQVLNRGHQMRAYDRSPKRDQISRDHILGAIVAVEHPKAPAGGWKVSMEGSPHIRAAAVIHKNAEGVPQILGEHLGGRHKWSTSIEVAYSLMGSGFIVGEPEKAKKGVAQLLEDTPDEFKSVGLGYVVVESAPAELLECYSPEKRRIVSAWEGHPVVMLKGGINGQVHFEGAGLVRYGAEREAEVQQILATDPDQLDDGQVELLEGYFQGVVDAVAALQTSVTVTVNGR